MNSIDYTDKPLQIKAKISSSNKMSSSQFDEMQLKDLKESKEKQENIEDSYNTNCLLEDSYGMSYGKSPYTVSAINRKFNNTQNLLHDKTSILLENVSKGYLTNSLNKKEIFGEEYFKGSNISGDISGDANKFFLTKLESIISQSLPDKKTYRDEKNEEIFPQEIEKSEIIQKIEKKYKINQLENSYISNNTNKFDNSNNSNNSLSLSDESQIKITEISENHISVHDKKNLSEIISISKETLNFGLCFPGEILKRRFKIKNNSYTEKYEMEIKFNFGKDLNFNKYFSKFSRGENANTNSNSEIHHLQQCENSMLKYNCYSFSGLVQDDEPISQRKINIKPYEESEVEVCLTTPFNKSKENLYAVIHIVSLNQVVHSIPIISTLEIPKLLCLKDLSAQNSKFPLISLMLEIKSKGQKFKLPFKNASLKDMQIEFSIDTSLSKNLSVFVFDENYYECQFIIFPSLLDISSQSTGYIDLLAKIRRIKNDENLNLDKLKLNDKLNNCKNKVRKIIIGKLKGSSVIYNFFVDAQIRG